MKDEPVYLDACFDFFGDPRYGKVEDDNLEQSSRNEKDEKGVFSGFLMTRHGKFNPH